MTPSRTNRPHHNSRNIQPRRPGATPDKPGNRFQVTYIIITAVVTCSLLAVGLATLDFGSILGDDEDPGNYVDPNADLIAEQQTVVAENPDDVDEMVLLANLLGNTGQINEAIPLYERALELRPDDQGIRLDFARSLAGAGFHPDSESQFLRVLEAEPENQTAHYYLAELYMVWDPPRQAEADEHYQRAVEIDPDSFLGERAQIELDTMGSSTPGPDPSSSPETQGP